jgi:hypothetical protein
MVIVLTDKPVKILAKLPIALFKNTMKLSQKNKSTYELKDNKSKLDICHTKIL